MTNLQLRYQLVQLQNLIRQILHPLPVAPGAAAANEEGTRVSVAYSRGIQLTNMLLLKTRHELEDIYFQYILKPRLRDLEACDVPEPEPEPTAPVAAATPTPPPAAVAATLSLLQMLHRRNSLRRFQPPLPHIV